MFVPVLKETTERNDNKTITPLSMCNVSVSRSENFPSCSSSRQHPLTAGPSELSWVWDIQLLCSLFCSV